MKRFLVLLITLLLLTVPAMADELPEDIAEDVATEEPADPVIIDTQTKKDNGVVVNVTIAQPEIPTEPVGEDLEETESALVEDAPLVRTFSVSSPDVVAALESLDGSAAMSDVVTAVLGEYQRQTYTVQQMDSEGNVISSSTEYVPGLAGLDYPWIAGAVLFGLLLAGFLRLIGGLLRL
ncbi:hypothetical protein [Oscillibacter sp.]|uniref:hypothetical protein n=1 Tax=Oscillibacter sp. TaxID=1945593 RepID=UPI0028A8C056|nr:hypothetical protein [Oscillibacter sp.]